jgi:hypothetical protein
MTVLLTVVIWEYNTSLRGRHSEGDFFESRMDTEYYGIYFVVAVSLLRQVTGEYACKPMLK